MAYTPKYITEENVPVQIPDDYSQTEKLDAIQLAESLIELELNDGETFQTVSSVHEAAIKQRATAELAKGAEDPNDVTIADIRDDGSNKTEYAHQAFKRHYDELVSKIRAFKESSNTGPYVYSTSKSENRNEWERLEDNIEVDWDEDFARKDEV